MLSSPIRTSRAVVAGMALLGALFISAAPAGASPPSYVALGDSYTSGPLILPVSNAPAECLQSAINYPHLVAAAEGLALTDVSCSGATTSDLTTSSQYQGVPPQFDALTPSTSVVTVGIGGNDNNLFIDALVTCSALDIGDFLNIGSPCKDVEGNTYANDIKSDASTVGAAFAKIHTRSPAAKVFVVGYPDILPQSGNCYPTMPLTTGDTAYLNGIEKDLNSMLQTEAQANGATFVDTYNPSIGHDACQPEGVRWVEPPIPSTDAFPVHPNAAGEAADARDVEAAFSAAGIS